VTTVFIPPSLRYFERLWGTAETIKFIAVTIVASNIIAFGLSWIEYFVFQSPAFACVRSRFTRENPNLLPVSEFNIMGKWLCRPVSWSPSLRRFRSTRSKSLVSLRLASR
jgi:hypothetical protein